MLASGPPRKAGPTKAGFGLWLGLALEGGSVGRAVFVYGGFFLLAGFLGRNDPVKMAILGHGAEEEVCVGGEKRNGVAEKLCGVDGIGLLRFAALD